jgi:hypothetical protein
MEGRGSRVLKDSFILFKILRVELELTAMESRMLKQIFKEAGKIFAGKTGC